MNLISQIALKDILRRLNSRLGHDLPIHVSVTDRVISPFREDFVFAKTSEFTALSRS